MNEWPGLLEIYLGTHFFFTTFYYFRFIFALVLVIRPNYLVHPLQILPMMMM